jgi:hypothetical protein
MNYQEMYEELLSKFEQLIAKFEQYKLESVKWSMQDFFELNKIYADKGVYITTEQAQKALECMIKRHDAEYGITWRYKEEIMNSIRTGEFKYNEDLHNNLNTETND